MIIKPDQATVGSFVDCFGKVCCCVLHVWMISCCRFTWTQPSDTDWITVHMFSLRSRSRTRDAISVQRDPWGQSLQAEALGVGDGDGEFVLELLPGSIRRQTDLIKAGVRNRQPAETQQEETVTSSNMQVILTRVTNHCGTATWPYHGHTTYNHLQQDGWSSWRKHLEWRFRVLLTVIT